jgi:serine acetyltransferase
MKAGTMFEDIRAIYHNDPACRNVEFLLYPGWHAIVAHRYVIHPLQRLGVPFLPRLLSQVVRMLTGIEIHPGARLGKGLFIDHGAGVVIGETAEIGELGDHSRISAMAFVVDRDIPEGAAVLGLPTRVLRRQESQEHDGSRRANGNL